MSESGVRELMYKVSGPLMTMPPIYHFNIGGRPDLTRWGWNRAAEVLISAQNRFRIKHLPVPMADELCERYSFINPLRVCKDEHRFGYVVLKPIYGLGLQPCWLSHDPHTLWLHTCVGMECYLPAGIGSELMQQL